MHIAINGWFVKQLTTGSGHYLEQLLLQLPAVMAATNPGHASANNRLSLLLPFPHEAYQLTQLHTSYPTVAVVGVKMPLLPEKLRKVCWEQIAVPLAARRLHADLLWVPYWAAPYWQPCPTVVTVHDIIHRILPDYRGGRLQQLYTSLVSHTARRADAIITVSHAAARDIVAEFAPPPEQIHVVYNGLTTAPSITAVQRQAVREKYKLPNRFFLYLGGFDRRKNVSATVRAYQRYLQKDGDAAVQLVIAGRLPKHDSTFAPDPRQLAADLGITAHVHFCGYIEEADKAVLYNLATAYIFPGLYEGFGLMVLEAMQAGTPVLTSAP
ncbi:MAG: glycosyltransferase family 1 protein [Caldilineaceae bacterium]